MTEQEKMIKELKEAQELFGKEISVLYDTKVVLGTSLSEPVIDIEYVFSSDDGGVWSGYLTGLVTEWATDYDYASGVFEEPYTQDTATYLEALNEFMAYYGDPDWNFDKARSIIAQVKNNYTCLN